MSAEGLLRTIRARIRSAAYLRKWVVLGAIIGVISGLGAASFFVALDLGTRFFLGTLAGFTPASPLGESGHPIADAARPWVIPLVVALGGLISGVIVFRLAPEAEGHGTDAAIAAFHHGARRIRTRIPLVKLVASAVTIGSGGSGGREGPTAQIGAGFGSFLARLLDLDTRDARIAVSTGMGAGIGAIFRAPLGGAVLAVEIPYREDVEADALVPAFVGSIVAFSIFGAIVGFDPIFGRVAGAGFTDPRQLVYYSLIGLSAGLLGRLYIGSFYGVTRWFKGLSIPRLFRPAIAGFAVGCLGLVLPGVLGTGYGWVQAGLDRTTLLGLPLWVVLLLPVAKILATSLSIGSGGSGGVFGPGMVIGGLLGAGIWRLLEPIAPGVPVDPSPFVIVAMMALFGSVAHAPLAVMLMVAEMTDSLAMLGPAMLAIGIATLVVGDRSMYASQLRSRADSPAHRFRFAMPLMAAIPAGDAARVPRAILRTDETVASARARLEAADLPGAPVVERDGTARGSVELADLVSADPAMTVGELSPNGPVISVDDALDDVLGLLADAHRSWAPVVADDRLAGILSARDVVSAYRRALAANVRQVRAVRSTGALLEADVGPTSPLAGRPVSESGWPRDSGFDAGRRDALAERLHLDLGRRLRDLSTGNRRKIALLLAFLADADLLVLDEPTNGLDPLMQHEFLGLVREARANGATVFLSSHVLSEVQRVADQVAVLREGKVVASGTVLELRGRARQRIEVWFEDEAPVEELNAVPGVADPIVDDHRFTATLSGSIQPLLAILGRHRVASMLVEEPDLEEAFLDLYGGGAP